MDIPPLQAELAGEACTRIIRFCSTEIGAKWIDGTLVAAVQIKDPRRAYFFLAVVHAMQASSLTPVITIDRENRLVTIDFPMTRIPEEFFTRQDMTSFLPDLMPILVGNSFRVRLVEKMVGEDLHRFELWFIREQKVVIQIYHDSNLSPPLWSCEVPILHYHAPSQNP